MSDELTDLYQELILDHNARPHNFGPLSGANCHAHGHNPLCGDEIEVMLVVRGDRIEDVHFSGKGCAISKASASMMTDAVKGKTLLEAETLFEYVHAHLVEHDTGAGDDAILGKLRVFDGVKQFPARVKCATLAWHTLHAALSKDAMTVTTE